MQERPSCLCQIEETRYERTTCHSSHRLVLHFLPKYAPETNPIERVWWHLRETITRNHKCQTLPELVQQAFDWFHTNNNHYADMRNSFAKAAGHSNIVEELFRLVSTGVNPRLSSSMIAWRVRITTNARRP